MDEIQYLVKKLKLEPHPEGGFFKETYRSKNEIPQDILQGQYSGPRNISTTIYFLLTSDNFSAFHRIKQDEIWHFYLGSPISLHVISDKGLYKKHFIGNDFEKGHFPQFIVKGGDWFASEIEDSNSFALAGCTVSPGFDFADFEMASQESLIKLFPPHHKIISKLTR